MMITIGAAKDIRQMRFDDYRSEALHLAVALVNTRPVDPWPEALPDAAALTALLDEAGLPSPTAPTEADLAEVRVVRAGLAATLTATDERAAAAALNRLLARVGARPQLTDHDGGWHLHVEPAAERLADRIAAWCGAALSWVVTDSGTTRFGVCDDGDCPSVYVDASRNAARRYCSRTCATRAGVAAYRARQRAERDR
jgi:predicted RNA-binding Zn ribbon-like protein